MAGENLNLGMFSRVPFVRDDLTLTREALAAMAVVQRRTGDIAGLVYADTVTNVPAGGIAATDVQSALNELDTEKATNTALAAGLATKQPLDATLTALAGLTTAADKLTYWSGVDTAALTDLSAFIRTLLDDANAATARGTLGLGAIATQDASNVAITGGSVLATTGVGYNTGAGGTVTQATSKSTGVTLNKYSGDITLNSAALAASTVVSFTLTNSTIAATDLVHAVHNSAGTNGAYSVVTQTTAGGSTLISVRNLTAGSLSEAIVIRFAVFKAATS